jgi:hypothetical protein
VRNTGLLTIGGELNRPRVRGATEPVPPGRQPVAPGGTLTAAWAAALFASVLQRSDEPTASQVRQAVAAATRAYGAGGCAARVAHEFGEHPETAATRMRWARMEVLGAFCRPGGPGYGDQPAGRARAA